MTTQGNAKLRRKPCRLDFGDLYCVTHHRCTKDGLCPEWTEWKKPPS